MELQFKDDVIPHEVDRPHQKTEKTEGGEELTHITASLDDLNVSHGEPTTESSSKTT